MSKFHFIEEDGTRKDAEGKIIFLSPERFIRDVIRGNHCFICVTSPVGNKFTEEHIFPKWILRKYDLYRRKIGIPNNQKITYGSYTIPCCEECNKLMGRVF